MKTIILLILGSLISITANAQETVQCLGNSCLIDGYETRDSNNDLFEVVQCVSGNCDTNGWNIFRLSGFNTNVICSDNSCYGKGFQEIDPANNNEILKTRACNPDDNGTTDCLANGWEDEIFGVDARVEQTRCTDGSDCRNGFITEVIIDNTASLEAEIAALRDQIQAKRQELRAYLRANKRMNFALLKEIISLRKERRILKKDLRNNGGVQILDSKTATCLSPGGCFTDGYTIN